MQRLKIGSQPQGQLKIEKCIKLFLLHRLNDVYSESELQDLGKGTPVGFVVNPGFNLTTSL